MVIYMHEPRRSTPKTQMWVGGGFVVSGTLRFAFGVNLGWDVLWLLEALGSLILGAVLFTNGIRRHRRGDDEGDPWLAWLGIVAVVCGIAMVVGWLAGELSRWWAIAGVTSVVGGLLVLRGVRRPAAVPHG